MQKRTFRITILGCRVNHAEARDIETVLLDRGLTPAKSDQPADLEIVHTCSVTNTAAAKSRHAVRRATRRIGGHNAQSCTPDSAEPCHDHEASPLGLPHNSQVVVTGCFISTNPREAAELTHSDLAIPHHAEDGSTMIERFADRIDAWLSDEQWSQTSIRPGIRSSSSNSIHLLPVISPAAEAGGHIRAELRIQDGCDAHCTFCIIPRIRKTLRSKRIVDAVEEARRLVDLGHREIVLTGIFIGAYGHETALRRKQKNRGSHPLADLLDAVARIPGLERLRISSMEPGDVTEPLLDAMLANAPVVVPHLHLPLQSGSDRILGKMNRQYGVMAYLDMIDQVNQGLTTPDGLPPAITTDIICGFPGEDEADFEQTIEVARRVGYLHMHVFPYSHRHGTAAARWTEQFLPPPVIKSRVRRLIDLEDDPQGGLSIRYRRRLLGRTVRIILEQPDKTDPTFLTGRCDHYALVSVPTDQPRGSVIHTTVTDVTPSHTRGELASQGFPLSILH